MCVCIYIYIYIRHTSFCYFQDSRSSSRLSKTLLPGCVPEVEQCRKAVTAWVAIAHPLQLLPERKHLVIKAASGRSCRIRKPQVMENIGGDIARIDALLKNTGNYGHLLYPIVQDMLGASFFSDRFDWNHRLDLCVAIASDSILTTRQLGAPPPKGVLAGPGSSCWPFRL